MLAHLLGASRKRRPKPFPENVFLPDSAGFGRHRNRKLEVPRRAGDIFRAVWTDSYRARRLTASENVMHGAGTELHQVKLQHFGCMFSGCQ